MDDIKTILEKEYCPPLDPSLLYALLSDHDLSSETSLEQLRAVLEDIKSSAETEELTTFDPSGSGAIGASTTELSPERAQSWHGDSLSEDTELTSFSHGLGSWSIDDTQDYIPEETLESQLSWENDEAGEVADNEKIILLQAMFPAIKAFDIRFALKKAGGRFGPTVESLLNQAFLEEECLTNGRPMVRKGIDGFADPTYESARSRKARGKRKKQQRRTSSTPAPESALSESTLSPQSRWDRAKEEIEFIAQRVHIPEQMITSTYHKSGASLPLTIAALLSSDEPASLNPYLLYAAPSDLEGSLKALSLEFPQISQKRLEILVRMTYPSTSSACDLIRAFNNVSHNSTKIVPQYLPRPSTPPSPTAKGSYSPAVLSDFGAANLSSVASTAFSQASAAYRKSKSQPLMAGAAGYYSSVGRDAAAEAARHEAALADSLVLKQSRAGEVDLHGVNVKNAVRIARSKVQSWWDGGAAEWARQGKVQGDGGLRVVTGIGRHSEGGRSKIGPAVGAMLVREGWKVEVGEGVIRVRGRVRK